MVGWFIVLAIIVGYVIYAYLHPDKDAVMYDTGFIVLVLYLLGSLGLWLLT